MTPQKPRGPIAASCLVCGQAAFAGLYDGLLRRCGSCGFITAGPQFFDVSSGDIYADGYLDGQEIFDYVGTRFSRTLNFRKRLERALQVVKGSTVTSVLEIGCAYGFFGDVIRTSFGGRVSYIGFDLGKDAVRYARETLQLDARAEDYLAARLEHPVSDAFMWDVIEHLPEPGLFIDKIHQDLAPGGRIHIGTPDISTPIPRIRGKKWRNIHPPTHLHYFSGKTISQFLTAHGFCVQAVLHPAVYRNVAQVYNKVFIENVRNPVLTKILAAGLKCIPKNLTLPVNTLDNMLVIAAKR